MRSVSSMDRGTQTDDSEQVNGKPSDGKFIRTDLSREPSPIEKTSENLAEDADTGKPADEEIMPQPILQKARIVSIPKRVPPALPPRNPHRLTLPGEVEDAEQNLTPTDDKRSNVSGTGEQLDTYSTRDTDIVNTNGVNISADMQEISLEPENDDRPTSSREQKDTNLLSPKRSVHDQVSLSGSDYSHEISSPDPEIKATPNAMHDITIPATNDEFHSVPTTPVEAPPPFSKV